MRATLLLIIAAKAIVICAGQTFAAPSRSDDLDGVDERLTQGSELSIKTIFSDSSQPEVQLTSTWPIGSRTFITMDGILEMGHGYAWSANNISLGMFYRPHTALLFGARVQAAKFEQDFQGTFTASTSWNGVAGGSFVSASANASYSKATGWNFDALASSDFTIGKNITGYAELWLSGNSKLNYGAALGVTIPFLNGSEATLQIHRDFGDLPAYGFLAEYYGTLGDKGSLTISGAWDKDILTGSHDFTLSFDTEFSLNNTVSSRLSGSSVVTDGHLSSSEAQFDVTFEREDGSFGLSASRSVGDYQNTTFAIEWATRW